jgi:hypothetical protein
MTMTQVVLLILWKLPPESVYESVFLVIRHDNTLVGLEEDHAVSWATVAYL